MDYYHIIENVHLKEPSVIVLGKFDGMHRGHRLLLETAADICRKNALKLAVFTIKQAPRERSLLMTYEEKRQEFEKCGVDILIECEFEQIKDITAEEFLEEILWKRMLVRVAAAGTDCRFGQGRAGDAALISAFMERKGCRAVILDKIRYEGREISSTYVREAVCDGRMELAENLLGQPYGFEGIVVRGNQLGRTLDFPTVNLIPDTVKILPPFGVYAAQVILEGRQYRGIANIGVKPTVGSDMPGVETYIADFAEEIYGKKIKVLLKKFIRKEKKFDSLAELKAQIKKDIDFVCK